MPTVAVADDLELHYETRGEGPPLLLIAGIPAIASDWDPLVERLSTRRRTLAYDNRGSGASNVTPGPYSTGQLADDAAALLDALEIEQADVFGMSLGGMIAQELALNHPQRVNRLVLGCTHCGIAHAERQPRDAGRAFATRTDDWKQRIELLAPHAFATTVDPDLLRSFVDKKSHDVQDPIGYQGQIAAALAHDTYDRLPRIEHPTLVITGDDDRVIPGESSEPLVQRIPNARIEVIPGTGHLFFVEEPDHSAELLDAFLSAR